MVDFSRCGEKVVLNMEFDDHSVLDLENLEDVPLIKLVEEPNSTANEGDRNKELMKKIADLEMTVCDLTLERDMLLMEKDIWKNERKVWTIEKSSWESERRKLEAEKASLEAKLQQLTARSVEMGDHVEPAADNTRNLSRKGRGASRRRVASPRKSVLKAPTRLPKVNRQKQDRRVRFSDCRTELIIDSDSEIEGQTKNKLYVCTWPGCTYSSYRKDKLHRHVRTHDPKAGVRCPNCPTKINQGPNSDKSSVGNVRIADLNDFASVATDV